MLPGGAPSSVSLLPLRRYAVAVLLRNCSLYAAALAFLPWAAAPHPWFLLIGMPLIGLAMYRLTIVMHDCVHGTLFASRRSNRIVGVAAGALAAVEFHAFARLHWQHHHALGRPDDPQGPDYLLPPEASRMAVLWHLLRPLLGCNLFKLGQVMAAASGPASRRWRAFAPVAVAQAAAAAVASGGFCYWWLMPVPALSAATFGLFLAQTRGFAEHAAMPGDSPEGCVRSHATRLIDRIFLYDLNFNLHREHHLHPAVPSCHLPDLRRELAPEDAAGAALAAGTLATIVQRIAAARPVTQRGGGLINPLPRSARVSRRPRLRKG
jgi:fatty acid desaturase